MQPRRGYLGRESQIFVIVGVYFFAREIYVANQASTTCRRRFQPTVETSAPPFFWEALKLTLPAGCAMANLRRALSLSSLSCSCLCSPLQDEGVEQDKEEEIQRQNFAMLATRPASD